MIGMWGWIMRWIHRSTVDTSGTQRARDRLREVELDDFRVASLNVRIQRKRQENNLGPQITRALRARRP